MKDIEAPRSAPPTHSQSPAQPSQGESAKQFARGFAKGVSEESHQIYKDTKELPARLAKTSRELAEDLESGRELRALAPLRAATHAIRNAKLEDAERLAEATVEGAMQWWDKPPFEKGKDVGRAATTIASDAAITVLTEGLGTLHKLRTVEKAADKAEDAVKAAKDVERAVAKRAKAGETSATIRGRQQHREWYPGDGFDKEKRLPSGKRPDAINYDTKEVIELKPDNPTAIKRGLKQVEEYRKELEETRGGTWTGRIETYKP